MNRAGAVWTSLARRAGAVLLTCLALGLSGSLPAAAQEKAQEAAEAGKVQRIATRVAIRGISSSVWISSISSNRATYRTSCWAARAFHCDPAVMEKRSAVLGNCAQRMARYSGSRSRRSELV